MAESGAAVSAAAPSVPRERRPLLRPRPVASGLPPRLPAPRVVGAASSASPPELPP
ncbi:hypothetical protein [Kocuria coralli]|uniref:hypothetical protein n=1 Tax=Kocuria coralli TaxID=1461025 RepID=UPI0015F2B4B1|nr:hypothetical protein [Kocuria coralli]